MIGIAVNGNAAHFGRIPDPTLDRKLEAYATGESDSYSSNGAKGKARVLLPRRLRGLEPDVDSWGADS